MNACVDALAVVENAFFGSIIRNNHKKRQNKFDSQFQFKLIEQINCSTKLSFALLCHSMSVHDIFAESQSTSHDFIFGPTENVKIRLIKLRGKFESFAFCCEIPICRCKQNNFFTKFSKKKNSLCENYEKLRISTPKL